MEKENRKVKNNVFVDLFYEDKSAEANIISLYNALHDKDLPEGTVIETIQKSYTGMYQKGNTKGLSDETGK